MVIEKHYSEVVPGVVIAEAKNGLEVSDLESAIRCFTVNRLPKVVLKLAHEEGTRIFGQSDGHPALGWVERVYRNGTKLLADFRKVPNVVARVLREGSPRLHVEVAHNYRDDEGRKWQAALRAVSISGVPFPTISTLGEMSVAFMAEGSMRRREEPSIHDLVCARRALVDEDYGTAVRQVLRTHPEAARQYLRIGQGPR